MSNLSKQKTIKSVNVKSKFKSDGTLSHKVIEVIWLVQILEDDGQEIKVISSTNDRGPGPYGPGMRDRFEADLGEAAVDYVDLIDWNATVGE